MTRYPSAPQGRAIFALLVVQLAAACGETSGGTSGNTELNVVIPNNAGQSSAPGAFDIEVVEYTISCADGIDNGPFLDNGASFDDDVTISGALEVLDTASSGVTNQDFGPDLDEVYVWQGFMDLPPTWGCTVQLRARDANGEVICTATESFGIAADTTTKVNVLMYCGLSFQAPVGMLDVDGDFSFNVANFCPDLFVLNCVDPDLEELLVVPGLGAFVYSGCQVRFRDGDSSCGGTGIAPDDPDGSSSCDPQVCDTTPEGLSCAPDPAAVDPGVTTMVTCDSPGFRCAIPGALFGSPCLPEAGDLCFDLSGGLACAPSSLMNCGGATADPECVFKGDTLGVIGDKPPAPLNVGEGGFLVGCTVADDDGDPTTPPVPLAPGATVTCTAVTTDGDTDCDKTKTVEVSCPGLTACQAFGGDAACQAASATVCQAGTCDATTCDGATAAACCTYAAVPDSPATSCDSEATPPAICVGGTCVSQDCNDPSSPPCDDGNECTADSCLPSGACDFAPTSGTSCLGGTGTCDAGGACIDNCVGVDCGDGNDCTDDVCTPGGGTFACSNPNNDALSCGPCGGGPCICSAGSCIQGCTVPAPVDAAGIPMACRNSFNQAVSTFPIDLLNVTPDGCILDGQAVDFAIDPVIALDTAFLEAAAQTLCDLGTLLTEADVTFAQVSVDSIAGATCTEQLAVLQGTPVTVVIPTECDGTCGDADVTCSVTSGISLPLPAMVLPCTSASGADGEVQICSTGTVPLVISLSDPAPPPTYTETYVGVDVGGGAIRVAFACNTSSTTNPAPGVSVGCGLANSTGPSTPSGQTCEAEVGIGDTGETPFPTSDCNTADGPPTPNQTCLLFGTNAVPCSGTCDTVPVSVDPSTVCATFKVQ